MSERKPPAMAIESPRFSAPPAHGHSIELHIEELVLHGFAPVQRYAIGDAVEREFARLFKEQGSPVVATENIEIAEVDGGAIHLRPGASDEATGRQLARAIYGRLIR